MRSFLILLAILPNIFINGIDVGGLEQDEALAVLEEAFDLGSQQILIRAGSDTFTYSFADFDARYDFAAAVKQAVEFSQKDGFFSDRRKKKNLKTKPLRLQADFVWNRERVRAVAGGIADDVNRELVEASYRLENGSFVFSQGHAGRSVDEDALMAVLTNALGRRVGGEHKVTVVETAPKLKDSYFENATQLLGSFATPFDPSNASRATNLRVANDYLNNTVILPNETLSVCAVLRPRSIENGYVEAGQIIAGLPDRGIGGGICQISSTLYMAALHAEMKIVSRQAHSLMVGYMQPSTDATLAEGLIDLKIKNNTSHPMLVQSILTKHSHTINIYGFETRPPSRYIRFESRLVEINHAEMEYVECPLLPPNRQQIVSHNYNGAKYELYKIINENGEISEEKINTSNYRPLNGVMRVGATTNP